MKISSELKGVIENPHKSYISNMSFSPNNPEILATSSKDRFVRLWKIKENENSQITTKPYLDYKLHLYGINCIKWNEQGNLIASGGNDCSINIFDVNMQKLNRNFRSESMITCIDFNYSSNLLLTGTFDNQVIVWDIRSKNMIYSLLSNSEPITSVSFSPDSLVISSSSYDGFCRIWDTFKSTCLKTFVLERSPAIGSTKFLNDSTHILISSLNNQLQIINVLTEEEINRYTGHSNSRYIIDNCIYHDIKNDANILISGSEDGSIYAWDVLGDQLMNSFKVDFINEENTSINNVTVNKNGLMAVSGFPDLENIIFYKINTCQ